jgi:hypothetical protein
MGTALSRAVGVSRQTLYAWAARGWQALEAALAPPTTAPIVTPALARAVLTLVRGIHACLRGVTGQVVSLGTIAAIIAEAHRHALA